jgi:hypothetical protein
MNWQLIEPDLPLIVADFAIVAGSRLARMLHYGICMRRGVDAGGDLVNEYRVVCGRRLVVFRSIFGRRAEKRCGGCQREYQSGFAEDHDLFPSLVDEARFLRVCLDVGPHLASNHLLPIEVKSQTRVGFLSNVSSLCRTKRNY